MNEEMEIKKISEEDRRFVENIANELREKADVLEKFAETNNISGIWLTTIRIGTLVDYLRDFVEEKKKGGG